jgi:hypothetical protein
MENLLFNRLTIQGNPSTTKEMLSSIEAEALWTSRQGCSNRYIIDWGDAISIQFDSTGSPPVSSVVSFSRRFPAARMSLTYFNDIHPRSGHAAMERGRIIAKGDDADDHLLEAPEGTIMLYGVGGGPGFIIPHSRWEAILLLSRCYGWSPHGTVLRPTLSDTTPKSCQPSSDKRTEAARSIEPWDGSYFEPEEQVVVAPDAAQLNSALGVANTSLHIPLSVQVEWELFDPQPLFESEWPYDAAELFCRATVNTVEKVRCIASGGSFIIDTYDTCHE